MIVFIIIISENFVSHSQGYSPKEKMNYTKFKKDFVSKDGKYENNIPQQPYFTPQSQGRGRIPQAHLSLEGIPLNDRPKGRSLLDNK